MFFITILYTIRLGLQYKTSPPIHAKLCHKSSQTIQAQITEKATTTIPKCTNIYGSKKKYATPTSTAPFLGSKVKKFIQQVCGKCLFLGRAVDRTSLCPTSAIASQSATPKEDTMQQNQHLLHYIVTQEEEVLPVSRFASAATGAHGPRPWRGFTRGPHTNAKLP